MQKIRYLIPAMIFFVLIFNSCKKTEEVKPEVIRPVKIITAAYQDASIVDGFPGVSTGMYTSDLAFRIAGPVYTFNVEVGSRFSKGQIIAKLDTRDYEIDLEARKARFDQMQAEFERYNSLYTKGSVSESAFIDVKSRYAEASAALEDAQNRIADASIIAPYNGIVSKKYVERFDQVRQQQPVIAFTDLTGIKVKFYISEYLSVDAKSFQSFQVTFNAYPDIVFNALLLEIGRVAEKAGYPVTLQLVQSEIPGDVQLNAGMSCIIKIEKKQNDINTKIIGIPVSCIFEQQTDNNASVWIVNSSNTVQKQPVRILRFLTNDMLAVEGIQEGDRIVSAGINKLVEGQQVKIFTGEL